MLYECAKSDETKVDKSKELIELIEVLNNQERISVQKQEEYLDFLSYLCDKEEWDQELILIKKADWNEFYSTDDEDYEMKIAGYIQASELYNKFNELVGIGLEDFEDNFVGAKYIDKYTYNTIELTIRINNKDEVFIVDAV